ncbi:MAG: inorganic phosphate transporter [Bryobacteraceae bacterium]|nr:inorganic phosphate transporter [Bryobacteraceae bacterium]MDW8378520.1 inorganic phosphate transporter [Bryobacterales bacterium]
MDLLFRDGLDTGKTVLLILSLLIACGFEFVNGFHDTANAVATVIYTRSMKPWHAVVWSGICNFLGVFVGGIAVAMAIVNLLPVELLVSKGAGPGLAMVLALLLAAVAWNLGTWYFGLPASSSHTMIGAILGIGLANSLLPGHSFGAGVNWRKAQEVGLALLISPLIGFGVSYLLLKLAKVLIPSPELYTAPRGDRPPVWWIRAILIGTCTGVSFSHGSNDGQKGVGLVMLILIGILPVTYALNPHSPPAEIRKAYEIAEQQKASTPELAEAAQLLAGRSSTLEVPSHRRIDLRRNLILADARFRELGLEGGAALRRLTDYAPTWVMVMIALSLGIGTMIGWQRIVVTVGEKIGKSHLTYAQGAVAETVAMMTIGLSALTGLAVSTTHVLSSGVAGTMVAAASGLQMSTVKKIASAWILTLPVSMLLSGSIFLVLRLFLK